MKRVLVDPQDSLLLKNKWYVNSEGYVVREIGNRRLGTRKVVKLHRIIMRAAPNEIVDHTNRDKLDNRRSNLRFASKSTNGMNRGKQINNTSGYKGVSFHKKTGKWRAYISVSQQWHHLGLFETKEQAHKAYSEAAKRLHKEFACV